MSKKTDICQYLNSLEKVIGALLVGALFIVLLYQTFGRAFSLPTIWTDEVARYLFILLMYTGAGLAVLMQKHIKIDILICIWPKSIRKYIELLGSIISVIFCAYVVYQTIRYDMIVAASGRIAPTLGILVAIPYAAVSIGFFLMCVRLIQVEVIPPIKELLSENSRSESE